MYGFAMQDFDIEVSDEVARAVSDLAVRHYGDNSMTSQQRVVKAALRWALDKPSPKITFDLEPDASLLVDIRWKHIWKALLSERGKNNKQIGGEG